MSEVKLISEANGSTERIRELARTAKPKRNRRSRADWSGEAAAVYCRISPVNDDDQTGVDRQERSCRELANRLGLTIARPLVFVDNNRSAWQRDRKRPGWDALLEAARAGEVRHILTYHPDRLMQQPRDLEELLQISADYDITLHGEANHRDLSDPDDRFFLRIEVARACRSSDDTSRRLKDALIERAQDGKPHTGKRRYGYDKSGTEIIPHEAEIVREIFLSFLDGETTHSIAVALNSRNEPTALGGQWNSWNVRAVLDSHHVAGLRVIRGEEAGAGGWPAIVDRGTWNEAQERRKFRAAANRGKYAPKRTYLLRGVVTCKQCGTHMRGSGGRYTCGRSGRTDDKVCYSIVTCAPVDKFVTQAAIRLLKGFEPTGEETATALSDEEQAAIEADREELAELRDMWDKREIRTREYREMRKTIEERIEKAERKLVVRPAAEVLRGLVGPGAEEAWRDLERREEHDRMNAVMRFLFNAVIIGKPTLKGNRFDPGRIGIDARAIRRGALRRSAPTDRQAEVPPSMTRSAPTTEPAAGEAR